MNKGEKVLEIVIGHRMNNNYSNKEFKEVRV